MSSSFVSLFTRRKNLDLKTGNVLGISQKSTFASEKLNREIVQSMNMLSKGEEGLDLGIIRNKRRM